MLDVLPKIFNFCPTFRNILKRKLRFCLFVFEKYKLEKRVFRQLLLHSGKAENVSKFSTCGRDGLVAIWDLQVSFLKNSF